MSVNTFQFPLVTGAFPYLQAVDVETAYNGRVVNEMMYGGQFWIVPALIFGLLFLMQPYTRWLKENAGRMPTAICLTCLAAAFIIAAFDSLGAGVLLRYVCDFGLLLAIQAAFTIYSLFLNAPAACSGHPCSIGAPNEGHGQAPSMRCTLVFAAAFLVAASFVNQCLIISQLF